MYIRLNYTPTDQADMLAVFSVGGNGGVIAQFFARDQRFGRLPTAISLREWRVNRPRGGFG